MRGAKPSSPNSMPRFALLGALAIIAAAPRAAALGCTVDETAGADGSCAPVDCRAKYAGARNAWDGAQRLCVPPAECAADEVYEPSTNTCAPMSAPPEDNFNSSLPPATGDDGAGGSGVPGAGSLDCGEHGSASADNHTCACEEGWYTRAQQDAFGMVYCDTTSADDAQAADARGAEAAPGDGSAANVAHSGSDAEGRLPSIIVVAGICLCALLVCGSAVWARRARRRRHARREREELKAHGARTELSGASTFLSSPGSARDFERGAGRWGGAELDGIPGYGGGDAWAARHARRLPPLSPAERRALFAAGAYGGGFLGSHPAQVHLDDMARYASHTIPPYILPACSSLVGSRAARDRRLHGHAAGYVARDRAIQGMVAGHGDFSPCSSTEPVARTRLAHAMPPAGSDTAAVREQLEARKAELASEYAEHAAYLAQLSLIDGASPERRGAPLPARTAT